MNIFTAYSEKVRWNHKMEMLSQALISFILLNAFHCPRKCSMKKKLEKSFLSQDSLLLITTRSYYSLKRRFNGLFAFIFLLS